MKTQPLPEAALALGELELVDPVAPVAPVGPVEPVGAVEEVVLVATLTE